MSSPLCSALVLAMLATPALASDIHGHARAIDGDSLMVDGTEIRLYGMDAPEYLQTCRNKRDGHEWPCGKASRNHMATLIQNGIVECEKVTTDKYNRTIARCHTGNTDLNRAMVTDGWAFAYVHYSNDYTADESLARAEQRGMWDSIVQPPWDWRREHPHKHK